MHHSNGKSPLTGAIVRRLIQVVVQSLLIVAILFVSSGRLGWAWAWMYIGAGVLILALNVLILPPELIAERGQPRENVKTWDKWLTTVSALPTLGMPIIAGLDQRWGWSPELQTALHVCGLVLLLLAQGLFSWAMASNRFFSTAVRIQMDRNQTVATGGPYRYVRHPGYVGYIASMLATPLVLGSLWALIPAALTGYLFVLRTALEDRTLQDELPGYAHYARQVRYRLLPGVW